MLKLFSGKTEQSLLFIGLSLGLVSLSCFFGYKSFIFLLYLRIALQGFCRTLLLYQRACTASCTSNFCIHVLYHGVMKANLRISIKDYNRNKNLKILLQRAIFSHNPSYACMNGVSWSATSRPLTGWTEWTGFSKWELHSCSPFSYYCIHDWYNNDYSRNNLWLRLDNIN